MKKAVLATLLLLMVAFWGATFLIVQRATSDFTVLGFLGLRFGVATICLIGFALPSFDRKAIGVGLAVGVVLAVSYLFQTYGLQTTTSTNSGLITGMFIVFVPLMSRLLFGVKTGLWPWVGIAVSVIGLVLLTGSTTTLQRGDLLTLLCAAMFGLQVSLLDEYAPKYSPTCLALGQMAAVAGLCLGAWLILERHELHMPTRSVTLAVVVTGVFGSALAFFVQTLAQKHLTAIETALIIMTEPVFAALVGRYWGGEVLSQPQWVGAGLIMVALGLVSLQPLRERRTDRPEESASPAN